MKKMNKRKEGRNEKGIFRRDLLKNKIFSILLMLIGCISVYTLRGDITVFLITYIVGLTLFFSKENVIG